MSDPKPMPWYQVRLWQVAWVRDAFFLAACVGALVLVYVLRAVTIPTLLALLLADVFHPVVDWAERNVRLPRVATAMLLLASLVGVSMLTLIYLVPQVSSALQALSEDLPQNVSGVLGALGLADQASDARETLQKLLSLPGEGQLVQRLFGIVDFALNAAGAAAYLFVAGAFTAILFVYFSVRIGKLPTLKGFLPASRREHLWAILTKFEQVFGGFVRGQLLVALFTGTGFAIGFSLVGVPHPLVPATVGGLLSIVPNGQASGWIVAMLLSVLDTVGRDTLSLIDVCVYPTLVYAVTQSLETFVVTPFVQGSYTRLHPLGVLAALIAGGSLGGLVGILLAIPIAACAKIVLREIVIPAAREAADAR